MPSLEEKKYASLKGAEQGYVPKGKEFRQEIRHLKKLKRGDALSTRQAHRLHYLKELRSRRATIGTAKTIGEILATYFTAGGYQAASGAVKAGIKVSKEIAKKAAETTKVGDPFGEDTSIGPVVSEVQFNKIQGLIEKGIEESFSKKYQDLI